MGLVKRTYVDQETVITAENLNAIQDAIIQNEQDIATKGTYSKPSGGIPASDTASGVQTSLGKADTALQSSDIDSTLTVTGKAADAKKTGDEISGLKNTISEFTEGTDNLQNVPEGRYSVNDLTGAISAGNNNYWSMSAYIPCEGSTDYTFTQFDITPSIKPRVVFLDNSDTVVGYSTGSSAGCSTITSPATAVKMVCWLYAGSGVTPGSDPHIQIQKGTYVNPDYIPPVNAVDFVARKSIEKIEEEIDGFEYLTDDCYKIEEMTENVFDPSKAITGYDISDTSPYFSASANCVISPPIPCENIPFITIRSSNYSQYRRWIVFSTQPVVDGQYVIGVSNQFTANTTSALTDYIISVPSGAKYMFAALKRANGGDNWTSDTMAYGQSGTSQPYKFAIDGLYDHDKTNLYQFSEDSIIEKNVAKYVGLRTAERFVPYSTGASDRITSRDIYNRCNLMFFTDNHVNDNHASLQNVADGINFINKGYFHVDALVNAGDAFDYYGEKATAKLVFKQFADEAKKSNYPVLFAKGNHDLNDWANPPAKAFDDDDWSEMWYNYAETWGIVRQTKASGKKSTWNYLDIPSQKIRIITVDVQDTDKTQTTSGGNVLYSGANSFYVSNEQMNWIAGTALNFDDKDEKDWGVILLMHQGKHGNSWYSTSNSPAYESAIYKLHQMCVAFNAQSTYSDSYTFSTDTWFNLSVSADFTRYASLTNKPHIICCLIGHEHYSNNEVVDGINYIWTGNQSCTSNYSDNRVNRIAGSTTQNLFDLISIDTKTRKIRMVRFGAGTNCFGISGDRFLPDGLSY